MAIWKFQPDFIIIDEAHRSGATNNSIKMIMESDTIKKVILLSANDIDFPKIDHPTKTVDKIESTRLSTASGISNTTDYYHGNIGVVYTNGSENINNMVDCMNIARWSMNTVTSKKTKRIVIFVHKIAPAKKNCAIVSLCKGWNVYLTYVGSVIEQFNASSDLLDSRILILPYKSCATSFSIQADEMFLFTNSRIGCKTLYQARRRCLRITSFASHVSVHYIGSSIAEARVRHAIVEIMAQTDKKLSNLYEKRMLQVALTIISTKFDIDLASCPIPLLLYLLHPSDKNDIIVNMRTNLIPEVVLNNSLWIRKRY